MKSLIIIFTFGLLILSCSTTEEKNKGNKSPVEIDGWNVKVEKGITDTVSVENWIPEPELDLKFINENDSTCLIPNLKFYPIELEEYIEKKIMIYIILRASLFPPMPNTYRSKDHFVVGWNLVDYNNRICCECQKLEFELIKNLSLTIKSRPTEIDFTE